MSHLDTTFLNDFKALLPTFGDEPSHFDPVDIFAGLTLSAPAPEPFDKHPVDQSAELAHVSRLITLGELTASIAHEVNQPLAAIVTNGETCLRWLNRDEPRLDKGRGASLAAIIRNAHRSSEIIRQLRALSAKSAPRHIELNINGVIEEAVGFIDSEIMQNRVELRLDLARDLPPVRGDRVQLQQVAINLIVNAIQALSSVNDRPRELVVTSRLVATDQIVVRVTDNGPGLDPDDIDSVFAPFFTTKANGVGLGLSICQSIATQHSGRLWATQNESHGATFHLSLPVRVAIRASRRAISPRAELPIAASAS